MNGDIPWVMLAYLMPKFENQDLSGYSRRIEHLLPEYIGSSHFRHIRARQAVRIHLII